MITVFGNFEKGLSIRCVNATASAEGEFSGSVTYTPCGGVETTVTVLPGKPRILGCIEKSFTADPWVNVETFDACDGVFFDDGPIAAGFLEDAYTDEPISDYYIDVGFGFNLYMHSNVAWRLELSNSNLSNDGPTSGPPYTDSYDHELGAFDAVTGGTTLINLVNDADGSVLDTVFVTIGGGLKSDEGSGTGAGTNRTIIFTNTGNSEIYPIAYTYDMEDGSNASQGSPLGAGQSHSKQGTVGYSFNTNIDITYITPE